MYVLPQPLFDNLSPRPTLTPSSPPFSLYPSFLYLCIHERVKATDCYDFWPIVRATNVERVLSPPFEIQPADQGNKDEV